MGAKNLLNLNDLSIKFIKCNQLKRIPFTSICEFKVDPNMEWLFSILHLGNDLRNTLNIKYNV